MINQLRIYDVPPHNRDPFLNRFRDHAARIMANYGFRIQAMWTSETNEKLQFIYLLSWDDEAQMRAAWAEFTDDQEWQDIKAATSAAHGEFVLEIDDIVLHPTDFSQAIGSEQ